jgi:hypothetical protein
MLGLVYFMFFLCVFVYVYVCVVDVACVVKMCVRCVRAENEGEHVFIVLYNVCALWHA